MSRSLLLLATLVLGTSQVFGQSEGENRDMLSGRALETLQQIDQLLAARWQADEIQVAPPADDSEFLRRVYLDLVGVIPRVAEVRAFLADHSPDKRSRTINRLLDSPQHATHMANTWRQIMLPAGIDLQQIQSVAGVQNWLRRQFAQNTRYDRIVSDFLVATGGGEANPALYYTSLELKPEKLAASTSRIFLGLQIECAECHDHPFDHWTQNDFWGYAAFFAQLDQSQAMNGGPQVRLIDLPGGEVTLPDSETVVAPKYPDGRGVSESDSGTRRVQLAIWMASRDNPFLARAAVNRIWSQMFGRGLVEPVDDIGKHNPASHPELMELLTDEIVRSGFDVRHLMRLLANTRAYQLSSRTLDEGSAPDATFARMAIKTMTSEQLYDNLNRVLMRRPAQAPALFQAAQGVFDPRRLSFVAKMQMRGSNATEFEAGVLQALTLLNGTETAALTSVDQSGLLMALEAPFFSHAERVDTLFLATLSRLPSETQRQQFVQYVDKGGATGDAKQALSDVLWALLNSAEFTLNH